MPLPPRHRWAVSFELVAMLTLTFSTGIADAFGYLALDKVFTGNMTGNVVILGMGATGTTDLPVLGPSIALVGFMAGAAMGGRAMRGQDGPWTRRTSGLLMVVGATFGAAAVVLGVNGVNEGTVLAFTLTAALAAAMGLQAAVARRIAVKDVTTVVVTSTITGLAADSRLGSGTDEHPWVRRAAAIGLIGLGACTGALLLTAAAWLSVALSALLTIVVAAVGAQKLRNREYREPILAVTKNPTTSRSTRP